MNGRMGQRSESPWAISSGLIPFRRYIGALRGLRYGTTAQARLLGFLSEARKSVFDEFGAKRSAPR
jgi:hypothetical protein